MASSITPIFSIRPTMDSISVSIACLRGSQRDLTKTSGFHSMSAVLESQKEKSMMQSQPISMSHQRCSGWPESHFETTLTGHQSHLRVTRRKKSTSMSRWNTGEVRSSRESTMALVSRDCQPLRDFLMLTDVPGPEAVRQHTTYKSVRIVGDDYDLYYSVFCTNERELYDLTVCSNRVPSDVRAANILDRSIRNEQSPPVRITLGRIENHPGISAAAGDLTARCTVAGVEVLSGPCLH